MIRFFSGKKSWFFFVFVAVFFTSAFFAVLIFPAEYRYQILQNTLVQRVIPLYHSLRKLPDLVFFPYRLRSSRLPVYELSVKPDDLAMLNAHLPQDPFGENVLLDENKVEVNAEFKAIEYPSRGVKIQYRGLLANHWNSLQKSWRIKFPDENLFEGIKSLNLVIPYDRQYFIEPLTMYRARKLGLTVPKMRFVRLKFNGQDTGVYLAWEQWSKEWLGKAGIQNDYAKIFGVDDGKKGVAYDQVSLFSPEGVYRWKEYDSKDGGNKDFPELAALAEIITKTDNDTFKKLIPHLIDLPKFYAWDIVRILNGSNHQSDGGNMILIFNASSGKFEFVPFNLGIYDQSQIPYSDIDMLMTRRVFSIPEFRTARDGMLEKYLTEENFRDDLDFYDRLSEELNPEFLGDEAKLYNGFQYLSRVREQRSLVADNFARVKNIFSVEYKNDSKIEKFNLPESFSTFPKIASTRDDFLVVDQRFYAIGDKTITIGPGTYVFREDLVFPADLKIVIKPGTTMLLDEGVSLVFYSPLESAGTLENPVIISALDKKRPWGSILLAGLGDKKSVLRHTKISGGSAGKINGFTITAMFGAYSSDLEVENSVFADTNISGDDALGLKYGNFLVRNSAFENTYSDALDIKGSFAGSAIEGNVFIPPIGTGSETGGGDAIDLGYGAQVLIRNNAVLGAGDKCISVGEKSSAVIVNNTLSNCSIGVAVKDLSIARIYHNKIINNKVGVSLYKKKAEFGGGKAYILDAVFSGNGKNTEIDSLSEINMLP